MRVGEMQCMSVPKYTQHKITTSFCKTNAPNVDDPHEHADDANRLGEKGAEFVQLQLQGGALSLGRGHRIADFPNRRACSAV